MRRRADKVDVHVCTGPEMTSAWTLKLGIGYARNRPANQDDLTRNALLRNAQAKTRCLDTDDKLRIGRERSVGCKELRRFCHGLRNQQPVERVAMMWRQGCNFHGRS